MKSQMRRGCFNKGDIQKAVSLIKRGGVIIFPTETLYGIGCDATNVEALKKIYKIKNRPSGRKFPLLVKDFKMLLRYAEIDNKQKNAILSVKKPTNFILRAKKLPKFALYKNTGAIRISPHPFIREIFKHFNQPIVATSANLSGKPSLTDPRQYKKVFGKRAYLIDEVFFCGINRKKKGSRIVDLTKTPFEVLRK